MFLDINRHSLSYLSFHRLVPVTGLQKSDHVCVCISTSHPKKRKISTVYIGSCRWKEKSMAQNIVLILQYYHRLQLFLSNNNNYYNEEKKKVK